MTNPHHTNDTDSLSTKSVTNSEEISAEKCQTIAEEKLSENTESKEIDVVHKRNTSTDSPAPEENKAKAKPPKRVTTMRVELPMNSDRLRKIAKKVKLPKATDSSHSGILRGYIESMSDDELVGAVLSAKNRMDVGKPSVDSPESQTSEP